MSALFDWRMNVIVRLVVMQFCNDNMKRVELEVVLRGILPKLPHLHQAGGHLEKPLADEGWT